MANKFIIGILVFLVVLSGGIYAYSYMLSQQLDTLNNQLTTFQDEQEARVSAVSDEITTLRGETLAQIDTIEHEIDIANQEIDIVKQEINGASARIGKLEKEVASVATEFSEFSQYSIDASEVYQRVGQATVVVSDGDRIVGSGFILSTKAHAVTAYHVVEHLSEIYIILPDGRVSTATVAGTCKYSDIAVLALEDELVIEPPILADSSTVRVGEPVVTIGNPLDLTETLTSGIVSQTNRFVEIEYQPQTRWVANLIQFDAAVNFGNSGSPLVNSKGEVIGMVIARVDPEEGDGIYYAVSSNKVKRVATSLIDQGSFDYPWVGVEIANLTPRIVQDRELETAHGALVKKVLTEGPAEAAGIEADDIIVAIDGMPVKGVADLTSYLGEHKSPDELITLTLLRGTTELELPLTVGKRSS